MAGLNNNHHQKLRAAPATDAPATPSSTIFGSKLQPTQSEKQPGSKKEMRSTPTATPPRGENEQKQKPSIYMYLEAKEEEEEEEEEVYT